MKLVIDYREKKLIGLLNSVKLMNAKYNPIEILVENLPLSDVIIKDDKNNSYTAEEFIMLLAEVQVIDNG